MGRSSNRSGIDEEDSEAESLSGAPFEDDDGSSSSDDVDDREQHQDSDWTPRAPLQQQFSVVSASSPSARINLKHITLDKFDPAKGIHKVAYGLKRWVQMFEQAAEAARQLVAQQWNDEVLKIVMKQLMTGSA